MNRFEITIQRKVQRARGQHYWPVVVEYTLTDVFLPVRVEGELFLDLEVLLKQSDEHQYGVLLGEALFKNKILCAFDRARIESQNSQDPRLRMLLYIEDEALKTLHWERICISQNDDWSSDGDWDFLSLNQQLPFSFYLPSSVDRRFPAIGRKDLRALIIVASPVDLEAWNFESFDVDETVQSLQSALSDIPHTVLAETKEAAGQPTLDELSRQLVKGSYTILHFVCHGRVAQNGETVLCLSNACNKVQPVKSDELIRTLENLSKTRLPHFAFLSICESAIPAKDRIEKQTQDEGEVFQGLAQQLVQKLGMLAVVAMTDQISMTTAQQLSKQFYERLKATGEVDTALVEATAGLTSR